MAEALLKWKQPKPVILGIPRGGLIVAKEAARHLKADLDIVLTRKLSAPGNPELAIGSMTEEGHIFINHELAAQTGADARYLKGESERQRLEIDRRRQMYRKVKPKINLSHRVVIIVDDGVATGATVKAALWSARQEKPRQLIAAFPVGPETSLMELTHTADEVVCLRVPSNLEGVGQFYIHFQQLTDQEVMDALCQRTTSDSEKRVEGSWQSR